MYAGAISRTPGENEDHTILSKVEVHVYHTEVTVKGESSSGNPTSHRLCGKDLLMTLLKKLIDEATSTLIMK
jgi:hypothetical protein